MEKSNSNKDENEAIFPEEELIVSLDTKPFYWIFTLFGTAVGAGVLFLPVQAGTCGVLSLIIAILLAIPSTYYSHKVLIRFLMSTKLPRDYSETLRVYTGKYWGVFFSIIFFLTLFILLVIYSISLKSILNKAATYLGFQLFLDFEYCMSFAMLFGLILFLKLCRKILLKIMTFLVCILIALLFFISVIMIPEWNFMSLDYSVDFLTFLKEFLLVFPIMITSFLFFPAVSAMSMSFRQKRMSKKNQEIQMNKIILRTTVLLSFFILFFLFSCLMTIDRSELIYASNHNINCMTLLSMSEKSISWLGSLGLYIGVFAVLSSFIGVFFGVHESAHAIVDESLSIIKWEIIKLQP